MHRIFTFHFVMASLPLVLVVLVTCVQLGGVWAESADPNDREDPHRSPSLCEVCKYLTTELKGRLAETGKKRDVIETGYSLDKKKNTKKYKDSELRLIEAVTDPHVCEKIGEYNVHAERKGSLRFAKGRSETMETLHGLVHKGVNVELGIPYELWDSPSAGVTEMQRQCYKIVEDYEEDIEEWYYNNQEDDLTTYLCSDKVLKKDDQACLSEEWTGRQDEEDKKGENSQKPPKKPNIKKDKSKMKGDTGDPETFSQKEDKDEL